MPHQDLGNVGFTLWFQYCDVTCLKSGHDMKTTLNCMEIVQGGGTRTKHIFHLHARPSFSGGPLVSAGPVVGTRL